MTPTDSSNTKENLYFSEPDKTVTAQPLRFVVTWKPSLTVEEQVSQNICFSIRFLQTVLCWTYILQTDGLQPISPANTDLMESHSISSVNFRRN